MEIRPRQIILGHPFLKGTNLIKEGESYNPMIHRISDITVYAKDSDDPASRVLERYIDPKKNVAIIIGLPETLMKVNTIRGDYVYIVLKSFGWTLVDESLIPVGASQQVMPIDVRC